MAIVAEWHVRVVRDFADHPGVSRSRAPAYHGTSVSFFSGADGSSTSPISVTFLMGAGSCGQQAQ